MLLTANSESKRSPKSTSISLTQGKDRCSMKQALFLPPSLPPRNLAKWKAKPSLQENQTKAMCLEPSLCPDRHREFARANKFQSQRISAENQSSSARPHTSQPALTAQTAAKRPPITMTHLTALPRALGEVPKKEALCFPEKADTLRRITWKAPSSKPKWRSARVEKSLVCYPKGERRVGSTGRLPLQSLPSHSQWCPSHLHWRAAISFCT